MQDFHQLKVWQKAHAFVLRIYSVSGQLPPSENFGLTANLRRCAVAIPRTISEGSARASGLEFIADLRRARAAANEVEYLLLLCRDLEFLPVPLHDQLLDQLIEVSKMISGLISRVSSTTEPLR